MKTFYRLLTSTHQDSLNKCNLTEVGTAVGALIIFSILLLVLHDAFADDDEYEYVHCGNGVWYPEGTDCEVALKQYYGERYNDEVGWQNQYQYQLQLKQQQEEAENNNNDCLSEPDDNFYCKEFDWSAFYPNRKIVDELCDASEDYAKNPKNCDKAYDLVKEEEEGPEKKYCENSGKWDNNKKECKINDEEERTFYEDAVCDNEDADTTNVKMCMSDKRAQQIKNVEDVCDEVGGEMKKDGCHTDHDGPLADEFERKITEIDQEVKPKLLVPDEFKGTLTKKQKEALSKENPNWGFDKSYGLIPNSLEGTETPEQLKALSQADNEWEYEWEDTDSNPVPGTPSYKEPNQRESIKEFNDDGTYDLDGDPSTGIEIDDPVSYSHENVDDDLGEINNDTPQAEPENEEDISDYEDNEEEAKDNYEEAEEESEESEDDSGDSEESGREDSSNSDDGEDSSESEE